MDLQHTYQGNCCPECPQDWGVDPCELSGTCGVGPSGGQSCEGVNIEACSVMPYNLTQFPNLLGQQSQAEVESSLGFVFSAMEEVGCPPAFFEFFCLLAVPPCESTNIPNVPCRELCESGVECFSLAESRDFVSPAEMSIDCSNFPPESTGSCFGGTTVEPLEPTVTIRLANGNETAGRVEVFSNGEWGTICDDYWTIEDADVACRQLGFQGAVAARTDAAFGAAESSTPILLDDVECTGEETSLFNCSHSTLNNCQHSEDAGVVCSDNIPDLPVQGDLRLRDGDTLFGGRLEVFLGGQWGTVCDDGFTEGYGNIACKQLGFEGITLFETSGLPGGETLPILMDEIRCTGTEEQLVDCTYSTVSDCTHSEDVTLLCIPLLP